MNELDLSPFKVEFDRDNILATLKVGDIISQHENMFLPDEHPMLAIYACYHGPKIERDYTFYGFPDVSIVFIMREPSLRAIKAIYRINKFKY